MRRSLLLVFLLFAPSAFAQSLTAFLFPLVPADKVPGANGSLWTTELVIENSSDHAITLSNNGCPICLTPPPPGVPVTVPAHSTVRNPPIVQTVLGAYLFVFDPADAAALRMQMRVRDMSREAETFGTEVPVVPVSQFRPTIRLLDVPTDSRFRVTLRIYSTTYGIVPHVTVLPPNGTTPLRSITVPLDRGAAAALNPVAGVSEPLVRVVVDSGDPLATLWAFVSVTNNDTQDVTTITESP